MIMRKATTVSIFYLITCLYLQACTVAGFRTGWKNFAVGFHDLKIYDRSFRLQLIDPSAIDAATNYAGTVDLGTTSSFVQETAAAAQNSFLNTITARTIGTIFGNIFAAFIFKVVVDFFTKKAEEVKERISGKPEPPPATMTDQLSTLPLSAYAKLLFCILIDLGGDASFLLPGVGEVEDVAWAPISAYLLNLLFGSNAVTGLEFVKELLPGTDILPLATLAWALQNVFVDSPLTNALGLQKPQTQKPPPEKSDKTDSTL
jgi:hypothetical protein